MIRMLLLIGLMGCRPPEPPASGARTLSILAMNDWHAAFGERRKTGKVQRVHKVQWLVLPAAAS